MKKRLTMEERSALINARDERWGPLARGEVTSEKHVADCALCHLAEHNCEICMVKSVCCGDASLYDGWAAAVSESDGDCTTPDAKAAAQRVVDWINGALATSLKKPRAIANVAYCFVDSDTGKRHIKIDWISVGNSPKRTDRIIEWLKEARDWQAEGQKIRR